MRKPPICYAITCLLLAGLAAGCSPRVERALPVDRMKLDESSWLNQKDSCRIVILGSSTAAGTGPTVLDSAWAWRLTARLASIAPKTQVVNLAVGGYATYHLVPTGSVLPKGQNIDTLRNITAALRLDPDFIIINLPSNDAAQHIPVSVQLANYTLISNAARLADVEVFVTTPQPRNFAITQIAMQRELLDSTYLRFGQQHTIDFWTAIASKEGTVPTNFDSGDGIHLNDAAHRIFVARVFAKLIDTRLEACR